MNEISESVIGEESQLDQIGQAFKEQYAYQFSYQNSILTRVIECLHSPDQYGAILFLDTGAGKSYVAIKVIKYIFGQDTNLRELTPDEIHSKKAPSDLRKVIFLVNTQNLEEQQHSVINRYTNLRVCRFSQGSNYKRLQNYEWWRQDFERHDVFVFLAKKF